MCAGDNSIQNSNDCNCLDFTSNKMRGRYWGRYQDKNLLFYLFFGNLRMVFSITRAIFCLIVPTFVCLSARACANSHAALESARRAVALSRDGHQAAQTRQGRQERARQDARAGARGTATGAPLLEISARISTEH